MSTEISFRTVQVDGETWYELTRPVVREVTGIEGHNFSSEVIVLNPNGKLALFPPFRWNGRSKPAVNTANTLLSSSIHDALYELIIIGVLPKSVRVLADLLMRTMDEENGVHFFRRWYSHVALRLFGRGKDSRNYAERTIVSKAG